MDRAFKHSGRSFGLPETRICGMNINFNVSASDFIKNYQEKKPLLIKGAVSADSFNWEDVNGIYDRSDVASNDFKLSYEGVRPKAEYVESFWDVGTLRHRLIKPVVYDYMRKGATLVSNKIAKEQKVSQLSKQIARFTGRQVVTSAYTAFGQRDSFRCHWDTRDVFAIQLIGRKRWIVYEPSFDAPLFTQQSKDYEQLYPCPDKPYMDFILEAGDIFYLPRGWWHNPLPLGEPTFHLAMGTFPAYSMDFLEWAMKFMPDFPAARRSLGCWDIDHSTLDAVSRDLVDFITNPLNYQRFMDEFSAGLRVETPLALQIFGDPSVSNIPGDVSLRLNTQNSNCMDQRYMILNGTKLNLDDQGRQLFRFLAGRQNVSISELVAAHPSMDTDKLRALISKLCYQDILELVSD